MKICFFNLYSGINNRGSESFVIELANRLSAKNTIISLKADKNSWIVQPQSSTGLLKRFFLDSASLSVLLFSLKKIPSLLKESPDVIIPMNGFWQVLICKLFARKVLIIGHSGPGWDERWNLFLKPDVFVATTEPTAVWAAKTCPWTRVVVIPYGIDLKKFQDAKPVKLNLERPVILCPAAAVAYKRVHLAREAVSKLPKGSLLHIGQGASLNVPYDKIPSYYAASDVVTLPSTSQENSPMVFLEAMAAGKTVVTTDTKRARWILGEAGIFVNPENIEEYKNALEKRIEKVVIENQAKKYSWERIAPLYEQLIKEL